MASFPDIENRFRARIEAYREFGVESSTPDKGYVVVDDTDSGALFELFQGISALENPVNIVDESLLPFLGEYAPSFVADLNQAIDGEYPHNLDNLPAEKAVRLAMAHNALDNILFEGNTTPALLEDRFHRLAEIMKYVGIPTDELERYLQGSGKYTHTFVEATYYAKNLALQLYHFFAKTPEGIQTLSASPNEYPFIYALRGLFGDNLQNIILYGSSTNLRRVNDYDLLVIVDDISEQLYADLENKQREINTHSDRDVQMIIVPKKDLQAYFSVEGMPFGSIELVYGSEIDIPVFSDDVIQRVSYQANRIVRSLTSMQMAFRDPEYYVQKPHVLRGHLKLPKYLIESYRTLYGHLLPADFFDQLQVEFQTPVLEVDLTPDRIKTLRNKTMHDLFTIGKIINDKLREVS